MSLISVHSGEGKNQNESARPGPEGMMANFGPGPNNFMKMNNNDGLDN